MLIDCHTHAFADKIAAKAVTQLIEYYKIKTSFNGSLGELAKLARQAGLNGFVLLVAATKPEQVRPANDWILEIAGKSQLELRQQTGLPDLPQIIPFGTFHPKDPDWPMEIDRLKAAGIKGIKLHPEFQGIDLADPSLDPFFETVGERFVLMIHVGDPKVSPANFSTPRKIAAILRKFPKLKIIAAHLGGYCFWDQAFEELAGKDLFLDTSSAISYIEPDLLKRIISKHGTSRILFGSDYPLNSPQRELELLDRLTWLSTTAKEQIYGKNCAELLKMI